MTFPFFFTFQKEILKKLIERKQAQIRRVHPGLTCYREGVREIPVESIPGILEAGWVPQPERPGSAGRSSARSSDDLDFLYNAFKTILTATKNHQTAWYVEIQCGSNYQTIRYWKLYKNC